MADQSVVNSEEAELPVIGDQAVGSTTTVARPVDDVAVPTRTSERVAMFDAMRVVAALGVVFMHTPQFGPWEQLARSARFGVALFTTAAILLLARSIARKPQQLFGDYAIRRFYRLGVPLILWSVIYAGFYWLNARYLGGRNDVDFGVGFFLGGAAIHLWFIPFIFIVCVVSFPVLKFAVRFPEMRWWLAAAFVLAAIASLYLPTRYPQFDRGVRIFLEQSVWSVPTALAGIAIALVAPRRISESAIPLIFAVGGALYLAASYAAWKGIKSPAIQLVKAIAVTGIALAPWSPPVVRWLAKLGTLSFGVYLVHLMIVTALREIGGKFVSPTVIWFYPAVTALAFVLSYTCSIVGSKSRFGRILFP